MGFSTIIYESNFSGCAKLVRGVFDETDKGFLRFFSFASLFVDFGLDFVDEFLEHFEQRCFSFFALLLLQTKEIIDLFDFISSLFKSDWITIFSFDSFCLDDIVELRKVFFEGRVEWMQDFWADLCLSGDICAKEIDLVFQVTDLLGFCISSTYDFLFKTVRKLRVKVNDFFVSSFDLEFEAFRVLLDVFLQAEHFFLKSSDLFVIFFDRWVEFFIDLTHSRIKVINSVRSRTLLWKRNSIQLFADLSESVRIRASHNGALTHRSNRW